MKLLRVGELGSEIVATLDSNNKIRDLSDHIQDLNPQTINDETFNIVDMEAYAIAKICKMNDIDFRCFKYVSDQADDNASQDWKENVARGKKLFIEKIKDIYG